MQINQVFLAVLFISTPGILCYFLLKKLIGKIGDDLPDRILSIFLMSVASYILLDLTRSISVSLSAPNFGIRDIVITPEKTSFSEVLSATGIAIIFSIILSYCQRYKIWNKFAQLIKATNRFGDEDVFNYMLDSDRSNLNGGWVYVRDHKLNLFYYGYLNTWSESKESREIVLVEVDVYSNIDGKFLYDTDKVYISRKDDDISIEIPKPIASTMETAKGGEE